MVDIQLGKQGTHLAMCSPVSATCCEIHMFRMFVARSCGILCIVCLQI